MATRGKNQALERPTFRIESRSVVTAAELISEPEPAVVGTAMRGRPGTLKAARP